MAPFEFWFEFASTYSYPAALRVGPEAAAAGVPVTWNAFLLGPIFAAQGWTDSPFNIYPIKGSYMWRDLERLCSKYGLPLRKPSQFPRSGLLAARVASIGAGEPWLPEFVRAVYRANFAEDRDIATADVVLGILGDLGLSGRDVLGAAQAPLNKDRLRETTTRAQALGIFGAPSFVVGSELFWGQDRLTDALAWAQRQSVRPAR